MFYAQLCKINWEFHGKTIDTICVNWYYYRAVRTDINCSWRQIDDYVILIIGSVCGNSSAVEHRLAKAGVASSNLVSRSIHSSIAQLVEQSAVNRSVVGSSPTRGANFIWPVGQAVKTPPFHGGIPGSIPGRVTTWTISSAGRAPALQAGCRQFDPVIVHQIKAVIFGWPLFVIVNKTY